MEIEFYESDRCNEADTRERVSRYLKFVLFGEGDRHIVNFFTPLARHHQVVCDVLEAHPERRFVGSGESLGGDPAEWASNECEREIGYIKPEDPAEADKLLAEVRQAIERIVSEQA